MNERTEREFREISEAVDAVVALLKEPADSKELGEALNRLGNALSEPYELQPTEEYASAPSSTAWNDLLEREADKLAAHVDSRAILRKLRSIANDWWGLADGLMDELWDKVESKL